MTLSCIITQNDVYSEELIDSAREGNLIFVRALLKLGADIAGINRDGDTALHAAVANGFPEMVDFLVRSGASVHAKNIRKQTPLHLAAASQNADIAKTLINAGAEFYSEDYLGRSAYDLARANRSPGLFVLFAKDETASHTEVLGRERLRSKISSQQIR